ncbi:two component transcriptional regulator, LuxR family [Paenisporosarcina quisquiliarum]|jgi:DNA-binding NarL/FixJ family response regulator|uniref:response regulator n=1 Tax=Psychrobacillus TaxID=1221880 RepID=UPI0008CF8915|nr:response regulator transcription factor [Psychrobacillus psychrodurans]MCK1998176.1 response regulator transcription factor [Psychrobacillus psychrodurans]MCZ8541921.1 response regulator transcription factor [Psychrobacillus psychrodurans]SEN84058.1 two component transcriptional regulator, LuxR family [Paenisporosarcina quisquiliarum]SFN14854.1 DNA-binding response regulator, NarL/FixJ family, contains REC and HTH domains [Psychrobacillus psychrodurans]
MIRVLIADDHHVVRRGLMFFLKTQKDMDIVGEATNGKEAVQLTANLKPDVILMDLVMPVMDGIEATKRIKATDPEIQILMLTSFSDRDHVIPALKAGAAGYQLKDIEPDDLADAIRKLMRGENTLHPEATTQLEKEWEPVVPNPHEEHPLTPREQDVLSELTKGKSNREIASSLFVTEKTVKTHISNIFAKLHVQDRTQAALYAVKHGLTEPSGQ